MPIVDSLRAEGSGAKELGDHPWQQAAEPFERLVEMAKLPGELVVDPFLGSGTTATACVTIGGGSSASTLIRRRSPSPTSG